jgi:hypothetical protein
MIKINFNGIELEEITRADFDRSKNVFKLMEWNRVGKFEKEFYFKRKD